MAAPVWLINMCLIYHVQNINQNLLKLSNKMEIFQEHLQGDPRSQSAGERLAGKSRA